MIKINYTLVSSVSTLSHQPSIVPSAHAIVDARRVSDWMSRCDPILPRLETIAKQGSLAILEKEIQNIVPLLEEGKQLIASSAHLGSVAQMIERLAKPRFAKLQQIYCDAQTKIHADPKLKVKHGRLEKKWLALGLPISVLESHLDCAQFLMDSKLIFAILGYKQTCGDGATHDLKLDGDGHPMIRMQGRFTRWEVIARQLEFDPTTDKIYSRGGARENACTWNYFHPLGLVPQDRFNYDAVYPIHELSQGEYDHLLAHSKKFYESNPELDPGTFKDCIVQVFTSPRRYGIPEHPLLENLHKNIPVHVGIRLITADRQVYSFGYQMPFEEQALVLFDPLSNYAMTARCKVSMLDYEEFRAHEGRIVTSVPLSGQRCQNILGFLNELNQKKLRFQFVRQNCTVLMQEVMQQAGYMIPIRTTAARVIIDILPYLNQFPLIGNTISKIEQCAKRIWEALPEWLSCSIEKTRQVIFYVPEKLCTILFNFGIWKIGGAKKTSPLEEGVDEELTDAPGIQNFSSVIRCWTDLFEDQTSSVVHPKFIIDWQRKQPSTFIEPKSDLPKLALVPPSHE